MRSQNVHFKKKLTGKTHSDFGEGRELDYNYLLSLFVSSFNYSKTDFDSLTPVEAFRILETKAEHDKNKFQLWQNELRNVSFFSIKASMGDTSHISKPQDLYSLPIDKMIEEEERKYYESLSIDNEFNDWAAMVLKKENAS